MSASTPTTEPTLLQQLAAGEPGATGAFMDQYGALIWSLARRLVPNQADAEDAVQEIFIHLWKSAAKFDPSVASEVTFVAMIARRRLIDRRRRAQRAAPTSALPEHLEIPDFTGTRASEAGAEAALVERVLKRLEPKEREVILLSAYAGYSHSQIAERTGMPLGTVKTNIRRGLARVRTMLEETRAEVTT